MSEPHLQAEELEAYVRDTLEPRAAEALESHVAGCSRCTTELQTTARLELRLREVAGRVPRQRWRSVGTIAPLGALAAAFLVMLLLPRPPPRPVFDDGEVWAPDAPPTMADTSSEQFDLSAVGRRALPRYERMTPAPGAYLERGVGQP
jgi:hypothetical protein